LKVNKFPSEGPTNATIAITYRVWDKRTIHMSNFSADHVAMFSQLYVQKQRQREAIRTATVTYPVSGLCAETATKRRH
jgi:hypothetical protein